MERLDRDHPVIKALHKVKPAKVRLYERGKDQPRDVALSKGRNRWRALLDSLDALAWERVEGLDESGATLCMIEPDDDDEREQLAMVATGGGPPDRVDDVRDLVGLMREVQRDTLREAREIYSAQADSVSRMLDAVTDTMRMMREAYETALRLQVANAATGGGESDGIQTMLQMAAMMRGAPPAAPRPKVVSVPAAPKVG